MSATALAIKAAIDMGLKTLPAQTSEITKIESWFALQAIEFAIQIVCFK